MAVEDDADRGAKQVAIASDSRNGLFVGVVNNSGVVHGKQGMNGSWTHLTDGVQQVSVSSNPVNGVFYATLHSDGVVSGKQGMHGSWVTMTSYSVSRSRCLATRPLFGHAALGRAADAGSLGQKRRSVRTLSAQAEVEACSCGVVVSVAAGGFGDLRRDQVDLHAGCRGCRQEGLGEGDRVEGRVYDGEQDLGADRRCCCSSGGRHPRQPRPRLPLQPTSSSPCSTTTPSPSE